MWVKLFADEEESVFIGDGDAIGLCLVHLRKLGLFEGENVSREGACNGL